MLPSYAKCPIETGASSLDIVRTQNTISRDAIEETTLKEIPAGSVLVVVRGMILAKTVPVGVTKLKIAINQDIKALIPNERVTSEYLSLALRGLREGLMNKVERSTHGTCRLRTDRLLDTTFSLPSPKH